MPALGVKRCLTIPPGREIWSRSGWLSSRRRRVGFVASSRQACKTVADLVSLGDLQCLARPECLLPDLACLLVAAKPTQRIARIPQHLGLVVAVVDLPEPGEGLLVVVERLRVASHRS